MQHHRKKEAKSSPSVAAAAKEHESRKVKEGKALLHRVLSLQKNQEAVRSDAATLTAHLLRFYPEIPTLWNIRRQALLNNEWLFNGTETTPDGGKGTVETTYAKLPPTPPNTPLQIPTSTAAEGFTEIAITDEHLHDTNALELSNPSITVEPLPSASKPDTTSSSNTALAATFPQLLEDFTHTQKKYLLEELQLTQEALRKFHKSYCIWFHRKWVVGELLRLKLAGEELLDKELELCKLFLEVDDRNFHCWQYRQFICKMKLTLLPPFSNPEEAEQSQCAMKWKLDVMNLEFTRRLINKNFSNYSAWFLRSTLPIELIEIQQELLWIREGIFTEPMDQSLWQYYDWLLFHRGCDFPRLLSCLYSATEHSFYLYLSDVCEIMGCTTVVCFTDSASLQLKGIWKPIIPNSEGLNALRNQRIREQPQHASYVWCFKICSSHDTASFDHFENETYLFPRVVFLTAITFPSGKSTPYKISTSSEDPSVVYSAWTVHFNINDVASCYFKNINGTMKGVSKISAGLSQAPSLLKIQYSHCFQFRDHDGTNLLNLYLKKLEEEKKVLLDETVISASNSSAFEFLNHRTKTVGVGVTTSILSSELKVIEELVELEPLCKYAWLARCHILEVIKPNDHEIANYYEMLSKVDSPRKSYYEELKRDTQLGQRIYQQVEMAEGNESVSLELQQLNIQRIVYPFLTGIDGISKINLSFNSLSQIALVDWSLPYFPFIEEIDLSSNQFTNFLEIFQSVCSFTNLKKLDLSNNPLDALPIKFLGINRPDWLLTLAGCIVISNCALASQMIALQNALPEGSLLEIMGYRIVVKNEDNVVQFCHDVG